MTPLAAALRRATEQGIHIRLNASSTGLVRVSAYRKSEPGVRPYVDAQTPALPEHFTDADLAAAVDQVLERFTFNAGVAWAGFRRRRK